MKKLAEQLAKDLHPIFDEEIPENPAPDWILSRLYSSVERLITERSNSLAAVMYRIDLPEKKINALMAGTHPDKRIQVLSNEILEREARKVWMRLHYASK
jgi:hypothetical protein